MSYVALVATSVMGALVTLGGVVAGAFLAERAQDRHWSRDKQIEACTAIIAESTRAQLALGRQRFEQALAAPFDWTSWNAALGTISMIGKPEVIAAAARMDQVFWNGRARSDLTTWEEWRDSMEASRLDFINTARTHVTKSANQLTQALVNRPSSAAALQQPGT